MKRLITIILCCLACIVAYYSETHQLLGKDFWDNFSDFKPDPLDPSRELIYVLKTAPIIDLRRWILVCRF